MNRSSTICADQLAQVQAIGSLSIGKCTIGVGAGAPEKVSEIDLQLGLLRHALGNLDSAQSILAGRLAPVSSSPKHSDSSVSAAEDTPASTVGLQIMESRIHVERLTGYINECIRLLAI